MHCLLQSSLRRCAGAKRRSCSPLTNSRVRPGLPECVRMMQKRHFPHHAGPCQPCDSGTSARATRYLLHNDIFQASLQRHPQFPRNYRGLSKTVTEHVKEGGLNDAKQSDDPKDAQPQQVIPSIRQGDSKDRWWHIWKYRRIRLVLRALRVGALSVALFETGRQAGIQSYAIDPRGQRQKSIRELLASMGAGRDGDQGVKKADCKEAKLVQRVFPRILHAAIEETRCQEQEITEKLKADSEDKGLKRQLDKVQRVRRLLKMWPQDGFLILDKRSPNAFVSPVVPGLVFVHSGLFDTEHYVPVKDFSKLEPNTDLRMRVKKGIEYYMPEQKKYITFKENQIYSCQFVAMQDKDSLIRVRVKWAKNKKVQLCIPLEDVRKNWTYSVCESDEHLAMLLGHEMSHVIHGHGIDTTYLKAGLIGVQLVMLAMLDVTGLVSLLTVLGMAPVMKYSIELPFSREHEFEADATGLRIAARAGFNPHDAPDFFNRLDAYSQQYGESGKSSWTSTHPAHQDRIERLESLEADAIKYYQSSKLPASLDTGFNGNRTGNRMSFLSGAITAIVVILVGGIILH